MPALNFKKEFVEAVRNGEKTQTIRKKRKYAIKEGDVLMLKKGMRTSNCEEIGRVVCKSVKSICVNDRSDIVIEATPLTTTERYNLALDDGFKDIDGFVEFFNRQYGLPFIGTLIEW